MASDVLRDELVLLELDLAGAAGELGDQVVSDADDLPSGIPVGSALPQLPLDAEVARQPVRQECVVVGRQAGARGEDRASVEAAPAAVHDGEDLVGDDDVRVELRVPGAGVEVVVGDGRDTRHVDLGDGAVSVGDARTGSGDLSLEQRDGVGDRRMMGVDDPRLGDGVGDTPEHGDRLRDAEREVEPRHRSPHTGRGLLSLDPCRLGSAVLLSHLRIESGDAFVDAIREPLVRRIRAAELFSRDRVSAHADQQRELLLAHVHARAELADAECADTGSEPAAGRRTDIGVVAGQRRRQDPVAVAGRDAAQQVLVAAARGHPAHRDRHGRFRPTALRCASFSTTPSICTPCDGEEAVVQEWRKRDGTRAEDAMGR
nr:hypothetical protein [Nocardioides caeni]